MAALGGRGVKRVLLALESGRFFEGESFGAEGETGGEVVFNTSLAGYQEIVTDPSYHGQMVILTMPHIGNYGVNDEDTESRKPYCSGLIVREASAIYSNWRAKDSLQAYLQRYHVVGVAGIDTRALTKHLRESGAMRGIISTKEMDPQKLMAKARALPRMEGLDLAKEVTCDKPYEWPSRQAALADTSRRVVVLDFGIKHSSLRQLAGRGCRVMVVPATTSFEQIREIFPDAILVSNGPGDPAAVTYGIRTLEQSIDWISKQPSSRRPALFGICLGHQLLGLAMGGKTYKLKFGHHGGNHPVKDLLTGKVEITSQNHGFSVDEKSLPSEVEASHINLNDGSCEGFRHKSLPIFAVQYHPEASPGPHDAAYLFDRLMELMPHA